MIKGLILVTLGIKLLTLLGHDVEAWATDFVTRHGIDLANRYVHAAIDKLQGVGNTQLMQMSGIAFGYSCLLFTEGVGLWLQKRWAEYLTAIATSLFIPLELYEIYERFTWVRIGILILNIFIVWYLVTRLKDEKAEQHRTRIKICGITNVEDAVLAVNSGAHELGFNFFEGSSRYVAPETASSIAGKLPAATLKVGVFVNQTAERVLEIASVAGLNAIQLHGDEDAAFIDEIRKASELTIIKALRVSPQFEPTEAVLFGADAILLDSYSSKEQGGTGATFDWDIAKQVSNLVPILYVAGGLTPENVAEAIQKVRPYAVDVCSRIESTPGKKDEDKLKRFIAAVRDAI